MQGRRFQETGSVFSAIQYVEDFLGPRTTQMPADRLPQQNGNTRTDSSPRERPMIVEVESNDNCETSFFGRFKEAGPARPVNQVKLYDQNPTGEWYWITGWSDDEQTPACQAYAQLVEDSGAGLTH